MTVKMIMTYDELFVNIIQLFTQTSIISINDTNKTIIRYDVYPTGEVSNYDKKKCIMTVNTFKEKFHKLKML